nr:class I SAM-dependent methyltransferase [Desulfobacterales bacterium]
MGYIFDFETSRDYEKWRQNPENRFKADLEKSLILDLVSPIPGERLLDIGCGTGEHLLVFLDKGLDVTGIDASPYMLDIARERLRHRAELQRAVAEDLPFDDNSYDIATIIGTLEFLDNPWTCIKEACRVAKDRVFLGVLNRYSLGWILTRIRRNCTESFLDQARFFSVWELKRNINMILGEIDLEWKTIYPLPPTLRRYLSNLKTWSQIGKNPFGYFIGVLVILTPKFRTANLHLAFTAQGGRVLTETIHT